MAATPELGRRGGCACMAPPTPRPKGNGRAPHSEDAEDASGGGALPRIVRSPTSGEIPARWPAEPGCPKGRGGEVRDLARRPPIPSALELLARVSH
eukprot:3774741-Heterocapsa_arctica.AAC.1